jgi:hypothetical protein
MRSRRWSPCSLFAASLLGVLPMGAQSVISTHSGVIHFFEGNIYLGDQALQAHLGKFPSIPQGAELRTTDGRAEVLLTPGVFLRMGAQTTIRMLSTDLADTQVELRTGSVMVESGEPNLNTSVTIMYKDWKIRVVEKGTYRIDADPPHLSVQQGHAEVSTNEGGELVAVEQGMTLPFAGLLVTEHSSDPGKDALNEWSNGRNDSITADNAITAQLDQDPASQTLNPDGFTYFPILGVPSVGLTSLGSSIVPYSSYPAQPGFSSIYLPGYRYRPTILGLMGAGMRGRPGIYLPRSPRIGGVAPGTIFVPSQLPFPRPTPVHIPAPTGARGAGAGPVGVRGFGVAPVGVRSPAPPAHRGGGAHR